MKTEQEIRGTVTPPRKVDTQEEFDMVMNEYRRAQTAMTDEMRRAHERLVREKQELGRQMAWISERRSEVNWQMQQLRDEMRNVGGIFHGLKSELIRENPRQCPPSALATEGLRQAV